MTPVMARPTPAARRRSFLFGLYERYTVSHSLIDLEFDNDNDKPLTAEGLDWLHRRLT